MVRSIDSIKKKAVLKISLLIIYLAVIVYVTLLNRQQEPERMAWLTLFGSYKRAWEESHEFILWGLIDNVIMMIPFGILLPWIDRKLHLIQTIAAAFVFTMLIEVTQYLTRLGYFDVDDIWNNLWGTIIGYGIFCCWKELMEAGEERRRIRWQLLMGGMVPLVVFLLLFTVFLKFVFGF